MTLHDLFLLASILVTGVNAGVFVAVQMAQVPVQRTLGARDFVLVKKSFELRYGPRMRVLVVASLLAPIPLYVTDNSALALIAIGHAFALAVLAVTVAFNLPVNRKAVTWDPEHPPTDWEVQRDRWHLGNAIRTPLSIVAFAALA
ncbi:MAG TPA: DUF1772 domain-containing protein, partial [Kofleriaceae bacterium]